MAEPRRTLATEVSPGHNSLFGGDSSGGLSFFDQLLKEAREDAKVDEITEADFMLDDGIKTPEITGINRLFILF